MVVQSLVLGTLSLFCILVKIACACAFCSFFIFFYKNYISFRFNTAGTILFSSSIDKTIKLWDLQGNCLKTLVEHSRYVNCLAVNSDSSVLASGSNDRTILIWDLTNSLTLNSHLAGVRTLLFNMASSQQEIPLDFICPITHEIMRNPAIAEGNAKPSKQ